MKADSKSSSRISGSLCVSVILMLVCGLVPSTACASEPIEVRSMSHIMAQLVFQLALIVIASRFFGHIFHKYLRQPRVLGELVSGMLIGPYALGRIFMPALGNPVFPIHEGTLPVSPQLYAMATIASIILLFIAGLETDLKTFLRYSVVGSFVGLGGVIVSFFFGNLLAVICLDSVTSPLSPTALFMGTLSTATSVGITARILSEERKMSSPEGVTILAGAVLDDVLGIILLAVVVGIAKVHGTGHVAWASIGWIALKAFGFWLICTALGIFLAPRITRTLKWFRSSECIAAMAFGIALLMAGLSEMAGLAMIIGAYIVGLSLSQTDMAHELHARMKDVYQFFVPIFFCIMGMLVDFSALRSPGIIAFGLVYTLLAILGKLLGCGLPALAYGFNLRGALRIGAGMLPRGEVTLIVASIGLSSGAIGAEIYGVAIMTLLIATIAAPPILIRSFRGGSGLRSKRDSDADATVKTIDLDFPTVMIADFVRNQIEQAFRNEEFFVHRIDTRNPIYNIRKDDISITLVQEDSKIIISTQARNEQLVRLIALEEVLSLEDLLESVKKMKTIDSLESELINNMFG